MRLVDRRRSRYAGHILRGGDGGRDLFGIGALSVFNRVVDEQIGVIAASGESRGIFAGEGFAPLRRELLLNGAHELLGHVGRIGEGRVAETFDRFSADLDHFGVVHRVAAKDAELSAEFARLAHDDRALREVSGDVKHVGIFADDLRQLRGEVLVALLVVHHGDDLAAVLRKVLFEEVAESDAVVLGDLDEHRGALRLQLLERVVSGARALEGVDKADAEDIFFPLRYERVRA